MRKDAPTRFLAFLGSKRFIVGVFPGRPTSRPATHSRATAMRWSWLVVFASTTLAQEKPEDELLRGNGLAQGPVKGSSMRQSRGDAGKLFNSQTRNQRLGPACHKLSPGSSPDRRS